MTQSKRDGHAEANETLTEVTREHMTHSAGSNPPEHIRPLPLFPTALKPWRPVLVALGCPDRPARRNSDGSFYWDSDLGHVPARLAPEPPGIHRSITGTGTWFGIRYFLRAYRVPGAVLLLELGTCPLGRGLTVWICDNQDEAGRRAAEVVQRWAGDLGLGVWLRADPAADDDEAAEAVAARIAAGSSRHAPALRPTEVRRTARRPDVRTGQRPGQSGDAVVIKQWRPANEVHDVREMPSDPIDSPHEGTLTLAWVGSRGERDVAVLAVYRMASGQFLLALESNAGRVEWTSRGRFSELIDHALTGLRKRGYGMHSVELRGREQRELAA